MERGYVITVDYDGVFMYQPLRYDNGQSYSMTIDRTSHMDLINYVEKYTSTIVNSLYFCLLGNTLESGLVKIDNDSNLDVLFDVSDSYGLLDMYVDHFGGDLSLCLAKIITPKRMQMVMYKIMR